MVSLRLDDLRQAKYFPQLVDVAQQPNAAIVIHCAYLRARSAPTAPRPQRRLADEIAGHTARILAYICLASRGSSQQLITNKIQVPAHQVSIAQLKISAVADADRIAP